MAFMWFYRYYNFQAILEDLEFGINTFVISTKYSLALEIISQRQWSVKALPLNLVNIVQGSPSMNILNALKLTVHYLMCSLQP